jgi:hypothetical protein
MSSSLAFLRVDPSSFTLGYGGSPGTSWWSCIAIAATVTAAERFAARFSVGTSRSLDYGIADLQIGGMIADSLIEKVAT